MLLIFFLVWRASKCSLWGERGCRGLKYRHTVIKPFQITFSLQRLFIMLGFQVFCNTKYRHFNDKKPKYRQRQTIRQFPVTDKRWSTVIPYIFFLKYRNTWQKKTNPVTPEKWNPPSLHVLNFLGILVEVN